MTFSVVDVFLSLLPRYSGGDCVVCIGTVMPDAGRRPDEGANDVASQVSSQHEKTAEAGASWQCVPGQEPMERVKQCVQAQLPIGRVDCDHRNAV